MALSTNLQLYCLTIILSLSLFLPPTIPTKLPMRKPIPYETVNRFCLHKRLNVHKSFCLRVLKDPHAAYAKTDDVTPLLEVAINVTTNFICDTLTLLQGVYEDKATKPALIPAVKECMFAYEEMAEHVTYVITDASQESDIAGLDGEVILDYIKRCSKAFGRNNPAIYERNEDAKNYAKLLIDIADGLSSKKS